MKKITSVFVRKIIFVAILCFIGVSSLFAQSWTSVDGGGTNGINSPTSLNSDYPSVALFNGELYAIWQENTGTAAYELHVKKYNGSTWTAAGNSYGNSLLYSSSYSLMYPRIVCYYNALYAAWTGFDAGIYVVHVKKFDGSTWTFKQDYFIGEGRSNINNGITANAMKIDIAVYNNELYAIWVEQDHLGGGYYNVRVSKFNGSTWTSIDGNVSYGLNYGVTYSAYNPTLCVFNNAIYAAWQENTGSNISQLRVRRYDGGSTWTFVDGNGAYGLNYSTSTQLYDGPFSLSTYNGKMYAFWSENNRIRVKRYDEINGWTTDIDGGTGWNHNSAVGAYYPNSFIYNNLLYATWEQNPVPRQVRVVSFNGTTKTFIDGDVAGVGINNTPSNRGHFPKLIDYSGNLIAVWSEELTSTLGSANQIRAKKYLLPPFVESVSVPANGTYIAGQSLTFTVNFSKKVIVSGGVPYIPITLNTGGTVNATYLSGSGSKALAFRYTAAAGNEDPDGIFIGSTISSGGATLQSDDPTPLDASLTLKNIGSTAGIIIDANGPSVISVNSNTADGYYNAGDVISINISFSETAFVKGTPTLALNSGGTAFYDSGSGTTVLTFKYVVASGQNSADLDYTLTSALSLSGGTIKDAAGNYASLILPAPGSASSLGGHKDFVIDNTAPTVTISSSTNEFTNGPSIPITITFSEDVSGFTDEDIEVTNGTKSTLNGGPSIYTMNITPSGQGDVTINIAAGIATDAAGNGNTLASQLTRTYDNIAPVVLSVSSTSADGIYTEGDQILITVTFSEVVNIGLSPRLTLNSGGIADYWSGNNTNILTFMYTVLGGESSADLDYLSTSSLSLSGGIIQDKAGNSADLTLPEVGGIHSLGGQKNILIGIVPIVTTQSVSDILSTSAIGNGNITNLGFPNPTAYGVCWSTNRNPEITDNKTDSGAISKTGSFKSSLTGLASGTTYYLRAYIKNIAGTSYGEEVSFITDGIITYILNGGTNNVANTATYIYGTGLTLSDPTLTGFIFGGWYDNESFTGSAITAISNTTKGNVILYAKWNTTTGINDASGTNIILYPNPAKDIVYIKGAKGIVYVYDLNSRRVLTEQVEIKNCINIGSLPNGMYIVKVNSKQYKLIKE